MDVDAALRSQIRNIETTYGKPLDYWFAVIDSSGLTKHTEVVAMLKADHGLAHGAAHRVSLLARQRTDAGAAAPADPADPADGLYAGAVRDGAAQYQQPDRPWPDPPGHDARGWPAGVGGEVQPAVHSPSARHRSHRRGRRTPRLARYRVRARGVTTSDVAAGDVVVMDRILGWGLDVATRLVDSNG